MSTGHTVTELWESDDDYDNFASVSFHFDFMALYKSYT